MTCNKDFIFQVPDFDLCVALNVRLNLTHFHPITCQEFLNAQPYYDTYPHTVSTPKSFICDGE